MNINSGQETKFIIQKYFNAFKYVVQSKGSYYHSTWYYHSIQELIALLNSDKISFNVISDPIFLKNKNTIYEHGCFDLKHLKDTFPEEFI